MGVARRPANWNWPIRPFAIQNGLPDANCHSRHNRLPGDRHVHAAADSKNAQWPMAVFAADTAHRDDVDGHGVCRPRHSQRAVDWPDFRSRGGLAPRRWPVHRLSRGPVAGLRGGICNLWNCLSLHLHGRHARRRGCPHAAANHALGNHAVLSIARRQDADIHCSRADLSCTSAVFTASSSLLFGAAAAGNDR